VSEPFPYSPGVGGRSPQSELWLKLLMWWERSSDNPPFFQQSLAKTGLGLLKRYKRRQFFKVGIISFVEVKEWTSRLSPRYIYIYIKSSICLCVCLSFCLWVCLATPPKLLNRFSWWPQKIKGKVRKWDSLNLRRRLNLKRILSWNGVFETEFKLKRSLYLKRISWNGV